METPVVQNLHIASDNETAFIPFPEGTLKSIKIKTGKVIWKSELGGEILNSLFTNRKNLYISSLKQTVEKGVDKKNLSIVSLSPSTGITQWKTDLEIESSKNTYLHEDFEKGIIYATTENGEVYTLDKKTGHILSRNSLKFHTLVPPIIKDRKIYVGDVSGKILEIILAEDTNEMIPKELKAVEGVPTAIHLIDEDLYVGDKLGKIHKLNINTKKIDWVARTGAEIASIVGANNNLLVSSADNFVYFISKTDGNRIWKKRFQGKNQGFPPVTENIAIFSPLGEKNATLIELKKGRTINQINLNSSNENSFVNSAKIFGDTIILSTLHGFYAFAERGCSYDKSSNALSK